MNEWMNDPWPWHPYCWVELGVRPGDKSSNMGGKLITLNMLLSYSNTDSDLNIDDLDVVKKISQTWSSANWILATWYQTRTWLGSALKNERRWIWLALGHEYKNTDDLKFDLNTNVSDLDLMESPEIWLWNDWLVIIGFIHKNQWLEQRHENGKLGFRLWWMIQILTRMLFLLTWTRVRV